MGKINVLSFDVANLIAAGEVVDRPASVIKELMENSIDAGAKHITVEVQHGGVTFMRVADDGCGISPEDLPVAVRRHATSKIKEADDLDGILTLGFRGEALAAIAAVSELRILTRTREQEFGTMLISHPGKEVELHEQGSPIGTTVIVENLFANVPARRKFLKRDAAETTAIMTYVEKIALSRPDIAVRLIVDGNMRLDTAGDGVLESAMYAVFGKDFVKRMIRVRSMEQDAIRVDGYIGRPDNVRPKRNYQNFFINGRYINSRTVGAALEQAYTSFIAPERFPCCVLNINIPPEAVDVNVHPAKLEVKFSNEKPVFDAVYYSVRSALEANCERPSMNVQQMGVPNAVRSFVPVEDGRPESLAARQVGMELPVQKETDATRTRVPWHDPSKLTEEQKKILAELREAERKNLQSKPIVSSRYPYPAGKPKSEPTFVSVPSVKRYTEEHTSELMTPAVEEVEPVLPKARPLEPEEEEEIVEGLGWRILGEAFHCYIFVEQGDRVVVIDKHAAHERLLFETLKKKLKGAERASQIMMIPLQPAMTLADVGTLELYRAEVEAIGFAFTARGALISVTEIPAELTPNAAEEFLMALASGLYEGTADAAITRDLLFEKKLYQAACKAAIKGGREYPPEYIQELCAKLLEIPDITVCPHGRPVAMVLSHKSLDRQFRRI